MTADLATTAMLAAGAAILLVGWARRRGPLWPWLLAGWLVLVLCEVAELHIHLARPLFDPSWRPFGGTLVPEHAKLLSGALLGLASLHMLGIAASHAPAMARARLQRVRLAMLALLVWCALSGAAAASFASIAASGWMAALEECGECAIMALLVGHLVRLVRLPAPPLPATYASRRGCGTAARSTRLQRRHARSGGIAVAGGSAPLHSGMPAGP